MMCACRWFEPRQVEGIFARCVDRDFAGRRHVGDHEAEVWRRRGTAGIEAAKFTKSLNQDSRVSNPGRAPTMRSGRGTP